MIKKRKKIYKLIPSEDNRISKNITSKGLKRYKKKKISYKQIALKFIIIVSILLISIYLIALIIFHLKKSKRNKLLVNNTIINSFNISSKIINKTIYQEISDIQKYVYLAVNGTLINPNIVFYKSDNPKISIVIPMFNAEGYIKNAITSIENQDFTDIEIIIIDDYSQDNSVDLVKDLMKRDQRIYLYQNEETKGTLYSKTKGVLYSKGKYVLVSDQDDLYVQTDAFSTMYYALEKDNLDILNFGALYADTINLRKNVALSSYINTPVIYQPYVSKRMFINNNGKVRRTGDVIWSYIFRTEIFLKSIKQIDEKFLNSRMNCHEDFLLLFLLTRNALNIKNIKRIFYVHLYWKGNTTSKILFSKNEKKKNKENLQCMSFLNYIEFLLVKTNNTIEDKRIASYELNNWYLNNQCKNNTYIKERGRNICKLFLDNIYIEDNVKSKINIFLNKNLF